MEPKRNCAVALCRWKHFDDYAFDDEPEERLDHWMTLAEIQRYKEIIAETHHLAVAEILQDRGSWVDKDGDLNSYAVFPYADPVYKRCIHGVKYGCQECGVMRAPQEHGPEALQRLDGIPEPPNGYRNENCF